LRHKTKNVSKHKKSNESNIAILGVLHYNDTDILGLVVGTDKKTDEVEKCTDL